MDKYNDPQSWKTRKTLIDRLGKGSDMDWQQFFETYWRLIYHAAQSHHLSPEECEEVVQETVLAVYKKIDTFRYDPDRGRFRSWLLSITRNKIKDLFRSKEKANRIKEAQSDASEDPVIKWDEKLNEQKWAEEWHKNLLYAALDNIRKKIDPKHFQVFHMINFDEMDYNEVSEFLGMSSINLYLINFRVKNRVAKEVKRLGKEVI